MKRGGALFNTNINTEGSNPYVKVALYVVAFIAFIVLALTIVHYTVYPIWRFSPTDKGVIGVPGFDSTFVRWNKANQVATLNGQDVPIGSGCVNWSGMLDIMIDEPTAIKNWNDTGLPIERVLFWRGQEIDPRTTITQTSTLLTLIPSYNVCIYLDKLTNDMFFSVLCSKSPTEKVMENVTIPNFPVRKSTRIGWMISEKFYEVYINGKLVQSKKLTFPPVAIDSATSESAKFRAYPPGGLAAARVQYLQLWNQPLSSAQFRALGTPTEFDPPSPATLPPQLCLPLPA